MITQIEVIHALVHGNVIHETRCGTPITYMSIIMAVM